MRRLLFFIALLLTSITGCSSGSNEPIDTDPEPVQFGKYVFAVIYENLAWGDAKYGLYIDQQGQIFYYDNSEQGFTEITDKSLLTEQELDQYLAVNSVMVEPLDQNLFTQKKSLVTDLVDGPFSDTTSICADAGVYKYYAFNYNSQNSTYTPVLIYQTGDFRKLNNDPNADEVKSWLIEKAVSYSVAFVFDPSPDANNWCTGL